MAVNVPAAYHGPAWQERTGTLAQEVAQNWPWARAGVSADHDALTDVVLHCPSAAALRVADPDALQHLRPMDYGALRRDIDRLAAVYRSLGVRVHELPAPPRHRPGAFAGANAMFARDIFWMTPEGAVVSRMASPVRAGEELQALALFGRLGVPVVRTVGGYGLFEGADALWLRPGTVAVGVGRRTNPAGADVVGEEAKRLGADVLRLHVPTGIQHLLGVLQVLDDGLLAARTKRLSTADRHQLLDHGFELVEFAETEEIRSGFAFNFVTVAPGKVVMTEGSDDTRAQLARRGVECVAVVSVAELFKGAGGIGCATGILARRR